MQSSISDLCTRLFAVLIQCRLQWFTMLSNCDESINMGFTITFLNPGGWWFEQFTVDEQGLLGMFLGWALMYTIGGVMLAWAQWQLYRAQVCTHARACKYTHEHFTGDVRKLLGCVVLVFVHTARGRLDACLKSVSGCTGRLQCVACA